MLKVNFSNLNFGISNPSNCSFKGEKHGRAEDFDMENVDIHTHGGFGIDFNKASEKDVHRFARLIKNEGTVAFCPTLATDSVENLNKQIEVISNAMENQEENEAKILGIHLEACFLNPKKAGIHNIEYFMDLTPENFDKLEDNKEAIKIVTLAPELDKGLIKYLKDKGVKVHAGHTLAANANTVDGTTHHFNAMGEITNRTEAISVSALVDNSKYCEIIADGVHVSPDLLKVFFKVKNPNRAILISDSLPIAHSSLDKIVFCQRVIYKDGKNPNGTLAGSIKNLGEITDNLVSVGYLTKDEAHKMAYDNPLRHLDEKF